MCDKTAADLKSRIARILVDITLVRDGLALPNPAIVDTIWITPIGTACDFLDSAIEEAQNALK